MFIFYSRKIRSSFLLSLLFTISAICFSHVKVKANSAVQSVTYNVADASIVVSLLIYDDEYGPQNQDGVIDNLHLKFSRTTGGNDWTDYYYLDYDLGDGPAGPYNNTGTRNGYNAVAGAISHAGGSRYWYQTITLYLDDNIKDIKRINATGYWDEGGARTGEGINVTSNVTVQQLSGITMQPYEFLETTGGVRAKISWVKQTLNAVDNLATMRLLSSNGTQLGTANIALNGSFNVTVSNVDATYYFQERAYGGNFTENSGTVNVPAFTVPKTATARYDTTLHKLIFRWTIDPVTVSNVIKDKYKIQYADNPDFIDAKNLSKDYDVSKAADSITLDKGFNPRMYFRVARDRAGFNWDLAKQANIVVPFNSVTAISLTLDSSKIADVR